MGFCSNCGKEIQKDSSFCESCGQAIQEEENLGYVDGSNVKLAEKQTSTKKIVIVNAILMLLLFIGVGFLTGSTSKEVQTIRKGTFNDYSNKPIGSTFENFFNNPKWRAFESEKGETIVEFTGKCEYDYSPATVKIQFKVNKDETFHMIYADVDGESLNLYQMNNIIDDIMAG